MTLRTVLVLLALACFCAVTGTSAEIEEEMCGDADDSGTVTVTDGVQTLRAAAGLSTSCTVGRCDVDGNGSITVSDGVNVLRAAAGLSGGVLPCAPVGRFVDNRDGTVTDTATGLQWEKKTGTFVDDSQYRECLESDPCNDPHDVENQYAWCAGADENGSCASPQSSDGPFDGPLFVQFLARLNTPPCFAGHCDWRIPTVAKDGGTAELETLFDESAPTCTGPPRGGACIDPIFGPTAVSTFYWTLTTTLQDEGIAWIANFENAFVGNNDNGDKGNTNAVRAVRTVR